jgi:hypothetical protein
MGAVIAAGMIRKQREVVEAYRKAGATSAANARTPGSLGLDSNRAVGQLKEHAVLRETASDAYYLDEPSWGALRRMRQRMALTIGLIALFALTVALIATRR